ncbi:MAG: flavodoxin family protein [Candidatus Omnitrophica bacterium]|nr:flavodoxin family protein [Candidatus Omnitrophota bacterium]
MKVIGISASPRQDGNSDELLNRALEGAASAGAEVKKIILNELKFGPCQECGGCDRTGFCVIHDGLEPVYAQLDDADAIVIASPVFFASVSAQLKMMIDRFQCRWVAKYILGKGGRSGRRRKGALLLASGSYKKEFFENSRAVVKAFFATLDAEYSGELFCGGLEKKGDAAKYKEYPNRAYEIGRELVING